MFGILVNSAELWWGPISSCELRLVRVWDGPRALVFRWILWIIRKGKNIIKFILSIVLLLWDRPQTLFLLNMCSSTFHVIRTHDKMLNTLYIHNFLWYSITNQQLRNLCNLPVWVLVWVDHPSNHTANRPSIALHFSKQNKTIPLSWTGSAKRVFELGPRGRITDFRL